MALCLIFCRAVGSLDLCWAIQNSCLQDIDMSPRHFGGSSTSGTLPVNTFACHLSHCRVCKTYPITFEGRCTIIADILKRKSNNDLVHFNIKVLNGIVKAGKDLQISSTCSGHQPHHQEACSSVFMVKKFFLMPSLNLLQYSLEDETGGKWW